MIRMFEGSQQGLDTIMEIWLEANISAHSFINEEYWKSNYDAVKEMMPKATIYICEEDSIIKAFVGITDDDYIAGIFVAPAYQAQGYGSRLLTFCKSVYKTLKLNVYEQNTRAVRFYDNNDFTTLSKCIDEDTGETELLMAWKRGDTDFEE